MFVVTIHQSLLPICSFIFISCIIVSLTVCLTLIPWGRYHNVISHTQNTILRSNTIRKSPINNNKEKISHWFCLRIMMHPLAYNIMRARSPPPFPWDEPAGYISRGFLSAFSLRSSNFHSSLPFIRHAFASAFYIGVYIQLDDSLSFLNRFSFRFRDGYICVRW